MSVKPIPAGYHTITAQLSIDGAAKAIDFYKAAFGAEVLDKAIDPSGNIVSDTLRLAGNTLVWVQDGVTIRLEAQVTRDRALQLAATFR